MRRSLLVLALLLFFCPDAIQATEISTDSAIVSVVVFPDRALVTRSTQLTLPAGEHTVHFPNLPTNIDQDSFQMKGEGVEGVRLYSTEARKVVLERPRAEERAKLEAEIENVNDQIAADDARLDDLKAEDELVHSIGVYSGEQFSKEFVTCEPKPDEWKAMVEFQRNNLARISNDILQTQIHKRELNRQLDALLRKLEELQGQAARETLDVSVSLSASRPGPFQLLLSYVIYGASWYPSYDARADVSHNQIVFTAVGNVRQQTGEDWENVSLSLSTARPAISAQMPKLQPWFLMPRPPMAPLESRAMGREETMLQEAPMAGFAADAVRAKIVSQETSVQFAVPYKLDIPSDNSYHRAAIFTDNLQTDFSYAATPKLMPYAYLQGKTVNTTRAYWLPGRLTLFVDGTMVGKAPIEAVAPNEEVTLDFGTDEAITVEREQLVRKEDESHIFGKKKERKFKDKLTVTSHKTKTVKLQLIDQIPVSQHEDIKITDVDFSLPPAERNPDTGIVKWDLLLSPNQKQEMIIEFTVTYPLDMDVFGL
jgi:uncharacterized protein (TIGR02231 family)